IGFHGFHIHETGICEGDFTSANGHFDLHGHNHGEHSGDLPPLEANETGRAFLAVHTSRFHFNDLFDADGSSFIVHAGADNLANIPERYGGADATTLANGDAGARVACGVIAEPQ
ncbi:MAG: superoxide dismutase family protein, partial [Chloroflexota bacterium]